MGVDLHGCVLAILVGQRVDVALVGRIRATLRGMGARVHLLADEPVPGFEVDALVPEVSARYYDSLVLPEGAPRSNDVITLIQTFAVNRLPLGAIGDSILLLAEAGVLRERRVACTDALRAPIERAGAVIDPGEVANDRVIITARDSSVLDAFCHLYAIEVAAYRMRDQTDETSMESFPGSDSVSGAAI